MCVPVVHFQGWEYAVDFPASFSKDKKWNSCVRRRRWLRNRRYKALGLWSKVGISEIPLGTEQVLHPTGQLTEMLKIKSKTNNLMFLQKRLGTIVNCFYSLFSCSVGSYGWWRCWFFSDSSRSRLAPSTALYWHQLWRSPDGQQQ